MKKRVIVAAALAVGALTYILWPKSVEIITADAQYGDLSAEYPLTGYVRHDRAVQVSAPADGVITYAAEMGKPVRKGDTVLSVDDGTKKELEKAEQALSDAQNASNAVPVMGGVQGQFDQPSAESTWNPELSGVNEVPVMPSTPTPPAGTGAKLIDSYVQAMTGGSAADSQPAPEQTKSKKGVLEFLKDIFLRAQSYGAEYKSYNDAVESAHDAAEVSASQDIQSESRPASVVGGQSLSSAQSQRPQFSVAPPSTPQPTYAASADDPAISISKMQVEVNDLQRRVDQASNASPVEGTVISTVPKGGVVEKGMSVMIIGTGEQRVYADISPEQMAEVSVGMPASFTYENKTWRGQIAQIKGNTIEIKPPEGFSASEGAKVSINVIKQSIKDVVILPSEAVAKDDKGSYVLVNDDGTLVRRNVVTGLSSRGNIAVEEGLGVGESVALNPESYKEGQKVKVKK